MKGQQQITLSYDSVREALEHYLHEHFAQNVQVTVGKWAVDINTAYLTPGPSVTVEFAQNATETITATGTGDTAP